jgi:photosystem II stability/assembly factor-like uncharacterized protein
MRRKSARRFSLSAAAIASAACSMLLAVACAKHSPAEAGGFAATSAADPAASSGASPLVRPAVVASAPMLAMSPSRAIEPAKGMPGVWEDVTPAGAKRGEFGVGNVVVDPARPSELYVGGYGEIWKSSDYGLTWRKLPSSPNPPELPLGHVLAVAGTTPATIWVANVRGPKLVFRSTDGGLHFALTGALPEKPSSESLYSIEVDPADPKHLISGVHEADGIVESTDSGDTWHFVNGPGWPPGGVSWFVYFIKTGNPETTRKTWFAIAQGGGSGLITHDAGRSWQVARGLAKLQHPHGGSSLFQHDKSLFVAGLYGEAGSGVFRSTDLGESWTRVFQGNSAITWGSSKKIYASWGWACAHCTFGKDDPGFLQADYPGDRFTKLDVPAGLNWGPNSVAITSDGTRSIYVGSMWATGLWRYVEP